MKLSFVTIAIAILAAAIVHGADKSATIKIQVVDNSSDPVGQRLVYQLKEKIRASHSLELIPNGDTGSIRIIIFSLDKESENPSLKGHATVFSVIWLGVTASQPAAPIFLYSTIGYTGSQRVSETAENILAETDRLVSKMTPPSG